MKGGKKFASDITRKQKERKTPILANEKKFYFFGNIYH